MIYVATVVLGYASMLGAIFGLGWAEGRNDNPARPTKAHRDPSMSHAAVRSWIKGAFILTNVVLGLVLALLSLFVPLADLVVIGAGYNGFLGSLIMAAAAGYQRGVR